MSGAAEPYALGAETSAPQSKNGPKQPETAGTSRTVEESS